MVLSVIAYKGKKEFLFIPQGKDKNGISYHLDHFAKTEIDTHKDELGKLARDMLNYSRQYFFVEDPDKLGKSYEKATGLKWSKFFKEHNCVVIILNTEKGFRVNPLFKDERHKGYGNTKNREYPIYELPLDCSDEELGEKIVESFIFAENNN